MEVNLIDQVIALANKAERTAKSEDALRFSQAACNVANAMNCVETMIRDRKLFDDEKV